VEKAAIIFSPTPNNPLCCFSTYLPEVKKEHTATGTFSEIMPIPLSSQEIVQRSFSASILFIDKEILGRI
jgi:hypothetical protein